MISIKQNENFAARPLRVGGRSLPDLRNLGVCLRILVAVNLMALLAAVLQTSGWQQAAARMAELSVLLQPVLLVSLLLLYGAYPALRRLSYAAAVLLIVLLELALVGLAHQAGANLFGAQETPSLPRLWLLTLVLVAIVLGYFNLRQRALSPAVNEARLQALQARIRPHFLFNSINAVLSIVRSDPARAETALEDMADLFRVLMADNRELVPLAQEIALCRQYLALEKLRLDTRLEVQWQIDEMPPDALIPPLILQPLLENAVYHGIEPLPQGGVVSIRIQADRRQLRISLSNPHPQQRSPHNGNKMALNNIRERLSLHFDAEASLQCRSEQDRYQVEIILPYRRKTWPLEA